LNRNSVLILFIVTFSAVVCSGQQFSNISVVTDTFQVNLNNTYFIESVSILPQSETIKIKDKIIEPQYYNFNYSKGSFSLSNDLVYSIFDTLVVSYQTIKLSLKKEYKRRELIVSYDDRFGDTIRIVRRDSGPLTAESVFGSGIEKSGAIVRGFTVGTNRDFSLQSGLRLQLSGKLSEDIEVVAALTDENTPIQPEGNTERLDELDKVFIQIKHKNASGTFGDYELKKRIGEFGVIDRKLQGLLGEFAFEDINGFAAIASSKGKFNSNSFNGQDGVQGPYLLYGINNEKDIILIAGSEKVFVDGEEMKRGERNDYTIDYSNSQITFTPNRLVTSASRINIDFEYTDRRFVRNHFSGGSEATLLNKKLKIQASFLQESDDKDSPIDITISEEDKKILAEAGDDINKAVKSGVSLAQPDSLGVIKGTYEKRDTTISQDTFEYYVYNPGGANSLYHVTFSFVGSGKGDYQKEGLGSYTFVGKNMGDYLPVIFLPLPEIKQFGNFVVNYSPFDEMQASLELAGSRWDKNRFSNLDETDNNGYARNFTLKMNPKNVSVAGMGLGKIGFSFRDRYIENRFTSVDRFNEVEFDRNYNTSGTSTKENEVLREMGLNLIPVNELKINSSYGHLKRGESFQSDRLINSLDLSDGNIYKFFYNLDYVKTRSTSSASKWFRHRSNSFYTIGYFKPGFDLLAEKKENTLFDKDSLISGSIQYYEMNPYLELNELYGLTVNYKYTYREDKLPDAGIFIKESNSYGHDLSIDYKGIKEVNSNIRITIRDKKYSDEYKQRGYLDNQTILVRSQSKFNFLKRALTGDLYYEVSTQKTAKLEKVFVPVTKGTGNYIYKGDLNGNGIADEEEFEPSLFDGEFILVTIPTDRLYPIIDLKASTRWKVSLDNLIGDDFLLSALLKPISTETYIRVDENSLEEDLKKIYLLQLSAFQNEKNTIRGNNLIQQDFFVFEHSQELSFRLRYSQRKSMNQFSGGVERGYNRERSLRIKFRLVKEISNQTDIVVHEDNLAAPITSNRNRLITGNNLTSDFSYRPTRNIEVGFKLKVGRNQDDYPVKPTIIDINGQALRFNLSFAGSGRLRLEIERNEYITNSTENYLPFELTGGNQPGKNYFWRVNFDYRIAANLQSTASYDGRLQGAGKVIHTARAEVRAFF